MTVNRLGVSGMELVSYQAVAVAVAVAAVASVAVATTSNGALVNER